MSDFKTLLSVRKMMCEAINFADKGDSVEALAILMKKQDTDSILVTAGGEVEGIVTESDIIRKVVAEGKGAGETKAEQIMTGPIVHIDADESIFDAKKMMAENEVGHLLVRDNEKIVGMIAAKDLVKS